MLAEAVRTLYDYNRWATQRLLATADRLTAEQLEAPGQAGHGSVRETLLHMLETQKGWLSWWDGSLPPAEAYGLALDRASLTDVAAIRRTWEEIERQTEAFVSGLTDADLDRVYVSGLPNGQEVRLPLVPMLLHVANHGTQHRSEVAAMLTGFGHSPGDLDLIFYHFATAAAAPAAQDARPV